MGIENFVLLSNGAKKCNTKPKKLESNLYEAILCAIYLDGGLQSAKKFVFSSLEEQFLNAPTVVDFATTLQEYCQANKLDFRYEFVSQSGTENDTIYQFELYIEDKLVSSGAGKTKKQAKHKCAEKALNKLNYKK